MAPELIVMPLITLITGVLSLFTDPNNEKTKWQKPVMLSFLVLTSVLTVVFGYQSSRSSQAEKEADEAQIHSLQSNVSNLLDQNRDLTNKMIELQAGVSAAPEKTSQLIIKVLTGQGYSPQRLENVSDSQIEQSLEADQLTSSIASDPSQRQSTIVQYFPKDIDPDVVRTRLQSLGFTVRILTPNPQQEDVPTNALWFGSNVALENVKAVAYTLIAAGIEIKMIRQLNNSQGRDNIIQAGGDEECMNRPSLTLEAIRNAQNFPSQREVQNCQS